MMTTGKSLSSVSQRALLLASGLAMGISASAGAQEASAPSSFQLEEIVVTAQKRQQSAQDVPIAITALTSDALAARGIDNVSALTFEVPTLQVTNFNAVAFVAIRGIGMENTTAGGDPGVALHVDGVYLARPVSTFFDQFDAERMEVLRGPQGTLYGRNATGGSINLISKKPTDEMEAYGDFTYGKFNRFQARGMVNLPITDGIAARATVSYEDRDGFQKNLVQGGTEAQDAENLTLRGHVRFDLSDDVRFLLSANYADIGGVGPQPQVRNPFVSNPSPSPVPLRPPVGAVNIQTPHLVEKNTAERTDMDILTISGTLDWDFDGFSVKSITAYAETSFDTLTDSDGSAFDVSSLQVVQDTEQFTQEFQFTSNDSDSFEWMVGLYFFHEESEQFSFFFNPTVLDNFALSPFASPFSTSDRIQKFGPPKPPGFIAGGDVDATSLAAFAHTTWHITPELRLTTGVRVSYDEKSSDALLVVTPLTPTGPQLQQGTADDDWTQPTGTIVLQWLPTDDTNFYASYARGYKGGGVNIQAPLSPEIDPETVNAVELGAKTTVADRLQLNASVYRYGYNNLQVQTFGPFGALIQNAASATIKGAELEWRLAVAPGLELNGTVSYLDAEYDEFFNADPFVNAAVPIDLSGNTLNRAPEWTASIGGQYSYQLPEGMGELMLRADLYYQTETFFRPFNLDADRADDYENLDFRLFWRDADDRFEVELYATNVTQSVQESDILRSPPFLGPTEFVTLRAPRQFGGRVGFRF